MILSHLRTTVYDGLGLAGTDLLSQLPHQGEKPLNREVHRVDEGDCTSDLLGDDQMDLPSGRLCIRVKPEVQVKTQLLLVYEEGSNGPLLRRARKHVPLGPTHLDQRPPVRIRVGVVGLEPTNR